MNIDKSMGFGLQKYAGIKDMNLAIELPSGLQPLPRAQGQKTPYRGGKKKTYAHGGMCSGGPSGKKGWQKKNNHKGDGMPGLLEADQLKKNYKKQTPNSLGTPIVPFHPVPAARTGTSVVTPIGLQSRRKNGNAHRCWQQEDGAGDGVKPETWSCQA